MTMKLSRPWSTQDHHLNKLGRSHIPNATHTKSQGHWPSGSGEDFFKGLLPYMGVGVILVMCTNFGKLIIRSLHMKFEFNWANCEKTVLIY